MFYSDPSALLCVLCYLEVKTLGAWSSEAYEDHRPIIHPTYL